MEETHDDVIRQKHIPRVGQSVRSRKYGTLWRIIEKKEIYQNTSDDPKTGWLLRRSFPVSKKRTLTSVSMVTR